MNDPTPNLRPPESDVSLLDPLLLLAENARLLVFGPIAAGLAALAFAFTITPTYTASTKILPPQQQQSTAAMLASQLGMMAGVASLSAAVAGLRNPADMYVAFIKTRTIADRMVDRFKLMEVNKTTSRTDARIELENVTRVQSGKDGLITIEVDDKEPLRAAELANAYVQELFRLISQLAITEAQQRRVFFEKQLQQAQENLKKAEAALSEVGAGESVIKSSPSFLVAGIAHLRAQITAQEIKLSTMRGYLSESSPDFQQTQRELAALRTQLARADRDEPVKNPQRADYLNRYRDFKYHETLFDLMAKQYELARLDEAREGAVIQVVDPATPPERKSKPRRAQIAVYTAIGVGFVLVLFVFVRKAFGKALDDPDAAPKFSRIRAGLRSLVRR